jgi:hypothetical protein
MALALLKHIQPNPVGDGHSNGVWYIKSLFMKHVLLFKCTYRMPALVLGALLCASTAIGQLLSALPVDLAWDASPDASVTGYALYYGPAHLPITNRVDVGMHLAARLPSLLAGQEYGVCVVAYNSTGMESLPTEPLFFVAAALSRIRIASQPGGELHITFRAAPATAWRVECTSGLDGASWQPLATVLTDLNGDALAVDTPSAVPTARFYRVSSP